MSVNAPPGLPIRWYSHQNTSEKTYGVLKAKLTGIKSQFGHYYSEVKLSEEDADKLIENIKKGPEGFPDLTDKTGIFNEEYQKWLVETYLPSAKTTENQTPSIEDSKEDSEDIEEDDDEDDDFEPLGLEEFLEDIQNEAKREKALALYEGTREDDLVSEEVDERLLRLLGLDDVFDIDYSTYMTLLREKMVEARMVDNKISTEESMLLTEEYKRIKGKVGRFKLKKKKISAEDLGVSDAVKVNKEKYYLTEKAITPEFEDKKEEGGDRLLKNVITINETLGKILESLTNQNQAIKKTEETERKRQERLRRQGREEDLEKGITKVTAFASKVLAPVRGILDRILNFILYTLLGRAFVKFIDWFNDPKNKEKVEVLKRFLKDWWPALLGALVLFTTPFGGFVRAFIGTVSKLTFRLAKFAIPKLAKFAMKNPVTAGLVAGGALAAGGAYLATQQNTQRREEFKKTDPNIVTPKETKETGKTPDSSQLMQESILQRGIGGFKGGGMIPFIPQVPVENIAYNDGGYIDDDAGVDITGAGPDTQLIAAQPGEIVMSKKAVDKYGAGFLLNLNKAAGGTNIPRMANNIQLAAGGGLVTSNYFSKGGSVPSTRNVNYFSGGGLVPSTRNVNYFSSGGLVPSTRNVNYFSGGGLVPSTRNVNYFSSGGLVPSTRNVNYFSGGGLVPSTRNVNYFSSGGLVPSTRNVNYFSGGGGFSPRGTDTVPSMLTPGEFVMSKGAVDKFGTNTMMTMNKAGGGTNKPKVISGTSFLSGGGAVAYGEPVIAKAGMNAGFKDDELAAFLAQVAHESGNFQYIREIWGPTPDQRAYEGRMDLGNTQPGDGKRYMGRGYIQITGRSNYRKYGKKLGIDLENNPELAEQPDIAARIAVEYWKTAVRPIVGDDWSNVFKHSRAVNYPAATHPSDIQGMADRQKKYDYYVKNLHNIKPKPKPKLKPNPAGSKTLQQSLSDDTGLSGIIPKPIRNLFAPKSKPSVPGPPVSRSTQSSVEPPKAKVVKPAGPKGIRESLSDDTGLSGIIPKNIRNLFAPKSKPSVPGPPVSRSNQSSIIPLPDVIQQAGGQQVASAGTQVPQISDHMTSTQRANASIYGIG